jgi:hypothetical protein
MKGIFKRMSAGTTGRAGKKAREQKAPEPQAVSGQGLRPHQTPTDRA